MIKLQFLILLMILLVLTACNIQDYIIGEASQGKNDEVVQVDVEPIVPEPKEPEYYSASISAIGDILIHNSVYEDAQIANDQYDFTKMFRDVKPYLENTDLTIANSESIIGGQELGLSSYPLFNSPYEIGDALKEVGVDVVNMANNHSLDGGEQAIINATNYWNDLGITYIGASPSQEASREIKTLTANNIIFSFLGYTYGTNGLQTPVGKEYLVNYIDQEKMAHDIQVAKEISDVVILNLHIGNEYEQHFNDYQNQVAQFAADQGVDLVIAHHPHVLQPVKWYEGREGNKTFVVHSLGNFLSAQDMLYTKIGAIFQIRVNKAVSYDIEGNETVTINLTNPKLLPTFVKFRNWSNYEIIPLQKATNKDLANANTVYEKIKSHMSQYVPELQFIEEQFQENVPTSAY
ncbi:poly-gamma-glutamate synthesis protein (capsule biosynthesis protein) [Lysinibacillus composti]|uniref:CapA family protein n=1 Tax=Lysinibacillus composti TaxID=720633 RepID=A0A3N9UUZ2_9BACI|nr:CapA family protein [Lysinibacillus composti]MBM7607797.1 poly-gamma-glutamate synthesis protein (capsule biosynthesis protein) [Lysinibacillus composti]RQW75716.1 CapA family protein [Lysinibacillus composti]